MCHSHKGKVEKDKERKESNFQIKKESQCLQKRKITNAWKVDIIRLVSMKEEKKKKEKRKEYLWLTRKPI